MILFLAHWQPIVAAFLFARIYIVQYRYKRKYDDKEIGWGGVKSGEEKPNLSAEIDIRDG